MRKQIYLAAFAALGVLASSCVKEKTFETFEDDPGSISFTLNGVATRADAGAAVQVNNYNLGTDDSGMMFSLEETVTWMGDLGSAPVTRGTPAFTENVQDVYGSAFTGVVYGSSGMVFGDGSFFAMEDGVRWRRGFSTDPWAAANPLTFFLRMPVSATGVDNLAYDATAGTVSFDYETPATAEDQQDLLFAKTTLNQDTYMAAFRSQGGAPVLFRHALTGVKFALNPDRNDTEADGRTPDGEVQTFITKVEFTGLAGKGSAVYTQDDSQESDVDNKDVYSSANSFNWTLDTDSYHAVFSQEYSEDDIQDYNMDDAADKVHGPERFYSAGAQRNLNSEDASFTFWFIPQDITADLKLTVTFYVWNGESKGENVTMELNLGERILAQESTFNKRWEAGQLRTFTIDPTVVDVAITDELDDDKVVKSNVKVMNTGNKDEYVRVAIVGNWVDIDTGNVLMGAVATVEGTPTYTAAAPWTEDNTDFGTFVGLGGDGLWVKKSDGFWYCTEVIAPGETPSKPVFTSYTKIAPPAIIPDAGLVINLVVQGVDASLGSTYQAAWEAIGVL